MARAGMDAPIVMVRPRACACPHRGCLRRKWICASCSSACCAAFDSILPAGALMTCTCGAPGLSDAKPRRLSGLRALIATGTRCHVPL